MRYFIGAVVAVSFVACGGEMSAEDLPEPAFHHVEAFATERYLRDDQIVQGAMTSEQKALANQLLGLDKKPEPVERAPAPKPVRRRRPAVYADAQDDWEEDLEPEPGVLSDFEFQDAIQAWTGMRRCLAEATNRGGERSGAIRVSFKIDGTGTVRASKVVDTSNAVAASIAPCVERRARRIQFPAFGGETMTKEAKFVF